jgi:hypothetical protein
LIFPLSSHRLIAVPRFLALLLVFALTATSSVAALVHTHAYRDHDHPEHHHGLSAHEHYGPASHPRDGVARLEGCDPGKHTVSFIFISAAPQTQALDAELTFLASAILEIHSEGIVRDRDVRVHGPPVPRQSSPRAPPLTSAA